MKRKLFVDLDGTLAEWRQAASMEDLLQEGYFSSLLPHKSLVEAVQELVSRGEEVYILSAYLTESKYAENEKRQWCDRWLPFLPAGHVLLVPTTTPKCECIESIFGKIDKNDFLLDDYSKNLHEWVAAGGSGIKYVNDVNWTKGTWQGCWVSNDMLADSIAHYIQRVMDLTVLGKSESKAAAGATLDTKEKLLLLQMLAKEMGLDAHALKEAAHNAAAHTPFFRHPELDAQARAEMALWVQAADELVAEESASDNQNKEN